MINSQLKSKSQNRFSHFKIVLGGLLAPISYGATMVNSGFVVVYNNLANVLSNGPGNTASPIELVVYDSTGACSSAPFVTYGGSVTIPWDNNNMHSSTVCTSITQIDVTPLATSSGVVQYNRTATTPSATATPISFLAPTTPYPTTLVIIAGNKPTSLPIGNLSATSWTLLSGMSEPAIPQYDTNNGTLITTGIPGLIVDFGQTQIG